MEIPINKPAGSEVRIEQQKLWPHSDSKGDIPNKYPLYRVYMGLIVKGPPSQGHHHFPYDEFVVYHLPCTKIYMGNGLVDNSTVPNCPMPNCASRNRSPTSFIKNPEEIRHLACIFPMWFWSEVMEDETVTSDSKKAHEFWEEVWCHCLHLPQNPSKMWQLSHCFLWGKKYFGEDNVASWVEKHAAGENCWWLVVGDFKTTGVLERTYSTIAGCWNSTTFMCFTLSKMEKNTMKNGPVSRILPVTVKQVRSGGMWWIKGWWNHHESATKSLLENLDHLLLKAL